MIIDHELERRERLGQRVRVGIVGAGFMGSQVARQIGRNVAGMEVVAVASRALDDATAALAGSRDDEIELVDSPSDASAALRKGRSVASTQPLVVAEADGIDVVVEATGDVECGARVATTAIAAGKHVVLVNADTDATLGPVLRRRADESGVVISGIDGDEPAVAMNLIRFVRLAGFQPVLAGNLKGFYDPHRNPETQRAFAESVGQRPKMITSFADGTKLSMECTILANATGLRVRQRGMVGYRVPHVNDLLAELDPESFDDSGYVDYVLGAEPGSGAFVVVRGDASTSAALMSYFKMGDGPLYLFYRPYHLPHVEAPLTVARVALFADAAVTPLGHPVCEVTAVAKRDLQAGDELDGSGGFDCFGVIENAVTSREQDLLPIGLAEGCVLTRDVAQDTPIRRGDVVRPAGRLADALHDEQLSLVRAGSRGGQIRTGDLRSPRPTR